MYKKLIKYNKLTNTYIITTIYRVLFSIIVFTININLYPSTKQDVSFDKRIIAIEKSIDDIESIESINGIQTTKNIEEEIMQKKDRLVGTLFYPRIIKVLSKLEYKRKNNSKARYYINLALNDSLFNKLDLVYKLEIYTLFLEVHKRNRLYSEIINHQIPAIIKSRLEDDAILILAEANFKSDNILNARNYLLKITFNNLNNDNQLLYHYLYYKLNTKVINSSKIGYKDPNISSLLVDKEELYIGTWHGGLIKYNFYNDDYKFYGNDYLKNIEIRSLYMDNLLIYIGTTGGVYVLNKRNDSISFIDELSSYKIYSITGNENIVVFGTLEDGILIYDKKLKQFRQIEIGSSITKCKAMENKEIFIGTSNGSIFKIDLLNNITKLSSNFNSPITGIDMYKDKIIVSTYSKGLFIGANFDNFISLNTKNNNFFSDYILSIVNDQDLLYCATLDNGIAILSLKDYSISTLDIYENYSNYDVNSIEISERYIFIGTLGEGVIIKNK